MLNCCFNNVQVKKKRIRHWNNILEINLPNLTNLNIFVTDLKLDQNKSTFEATL